MLAEKSNELNIDLNEKYIYGYPSFLYVCCKGQSEISSNFYLQHFEIRQQELEVWQAAAAVWPSDMKVEIVTVNPRKRPTLE